jgi:hypothetical protein
MAELRGRFAFRWFLLGFPRLGLGFVGVLRQLSSVLVLVLSRLSAWIVLFPIAAFRIGSMFLLGVGHGDGSCIAVLSPPFHVARSERVMRSTTRGGKPECGTT